MCVQGPQWARVQELVVPPPYPVHRAHAVLPSTRKRDPSPRADGQHHLRDQEPAGGRRPRAAARGACCGGRRQGRDGAGATPLSEPQGRDTRAGSHRAPDVVGPQRGRMGAELVGAEEPGLPGPNRRARHYRRARHGAAADRQHRGVQRGSELDQPPARG